MRDLLAALRDKALTRGVDFMDVRAVESDGTSVQLQDCRADKLNQHRSRGLGIRVLLHRAWGFASTDGYHPTPAFEALDAAGIGVIVGAGGRIRDTMEQLRSGALAAETGPNVPSRFGLRGDDT